ncbi:MAG: hypothetical protein HYV39_01590 [Candidatus Levybacteria bacterium]|nr:hypothetical protein [Candidatus Levybacteria bacterium]
MNIILFFADIFFLLWLFRNALFWIALWQTKEYRLDRISAHIKETEQGRSLFLSPLLFIKLLGILAFGIVIYNNVLLLPYQIFVGGIFFLQTIFLVQEIQKRIVKRPSFTIKSSVIFVLTIVVIYFFFYFPLVEKSVWLLLVDRLIPFFIAFFVFLFSFPTEMYRDFQIGRALQKIRLNRKMLVIGITGSYGKSSTKEFVSQILKKKFRLLKTKGTNNTPIGIARTINLGLQQNTEIFVVEMGAYKEGEIADICRIVRPQIGVLTAVNKQHVSLFGSLEKTLAAKYELIESLPKNGLAIFNGNNQNAYSLYQKTNKKKILYLCGTQKQKADIIASHICMEKTHVTFEVYLQRKKIRFKAPVIGGYNVENILPGIYLAFHLGMKVDQIKEAVSSLALPPHTMTRYEVGGISFIDDTFNANPQAVLSALEYMKIYPRKKILVLQPLIELGEYGDNEHRLIGKAIGDVCDYLLLTNKNYHNAILNGIKRGRKKCVVYIGSVQEIVWFLNKNTKRGDVVVFEGKEAGGALGKIL